MQAVDVERLQESARRYEERASKRTVAPRTATSQDERRREHLSRRLAQERALAAVAEAEAHGVARTQRQTLASLARERIIGSSDLVDLNYLEFAVAVSRAVCRIRIGSAGSM